MFKGSLSLVQRRATSVMITRSDIAWIDTNDDVRNIRRQVLNLPYSRFLVAPGDIDNYIGIARAKDIRRDIDTFGVISPSSLLKPIMVHENMSALKLMNELRHATVPVAVIVDRYGSLLGITTPADILEKSAGELCESHEKSLQLNRDSDGIWLADASISIRQLSSELEYQFFDASGHYSSLADMILWKTGNLPEVGYSFPFGPFRIEIIEARGRVIRTVSLMRFVFPDENNGS